MTYTHDEIIELLGAYALDAVDPDERDEIEAHLRECPRCTAEVSEHREVAAMLAHEGAPAPDGVWANILASLEEPPPELALPLRAPAPPERPPYASDADQTVVPMQGRVRRADDPRARRWLPIGAVAAALLLVVGVLAGIVIGDTGSSGGPEVAASLEELARERLSDPAARKASLASDSGDLLASAAIGPEGDGYLLGTTLPALDDSHTYQLWGISGDVVVSLGVLGSSPGVVAFHVDQSVEVLAITEEVTGGVPSSVNPPLLVGEVS